MPATPSPRTSVRDLVGEVERRLDRTLDRLNHVVAAPRPAAVALHRLHRDLRRLRIGVRVGIELTPKATRRELTAYDRRLKRLANVVGRVRDRDVALGLLADRSIPKSQRDRLRLRRARSRLADDARAGREIVRMFLRTERDTGLFEGIRMALASIRRRVLSRDLTDRIERMRDQSHEAVAAAHREARRKPSSRRLHRLRIRVRNLRHLADIASTLRGHETPPPSEPLRVLQRRLGHLHDLEVLEGLAGPARRTRWGRALAEEQHRQRARIVRELRRHRPREVVRAGPFPA